MNEDLATLKLPPGIFRYGTRHQAKNRWYDANGVRFINGTIQPIGGWRRLQDAAGADLAALSGVPRKVMSWRADDRTLWLGFGTTQGLYVVVAGTRYEITPVGFTPGDVDSSFVSGAGGYGNLTYGAGPYGVGSTTGTLREASTWQFDSFGQHLVAAWSKANLLYEWDGNVANKAAPPAGAPANTRAVVVTPERFLFALGTVSVDGGNQNARLVRWPSQETSIDWTPLPTNTAGEFELATNGAIVCGRRTKNETLIFTDCDVHAARYIGGTLVYSFTQIGDHCGIISPNAVAVFDTNAAWMGPNNFYWYDGYVRSLPSDVADFVFNNINMTQRHKIWATTFAVFGEVWWFYPSSTSTEIDSYVVYNYREQHWTIGKLARTAGDAESALDYPVLATPDGLVYEHEWKQARTGLTPFLESGPIELGEGDRVMKIHRIVPDEKTLGDVQATVYTSNLPTDPETIHGPYTPAAPTDVRLTGRLARIRWDEVRQTSWRIGDMRLGMRVGGRR